MTRLRRGGWWLLGLAVCFAVTWKIQKPLPAAAPSIAAIKAPAATVVESAKPAAITLIGSASCGAMECHGGNGTDGEKGSEYTTWLRRDPHATAYNVLLEARSAGIARNLKLSTPAHQAQVCLDCHATKAAHVVPVEEDFSLAFGVGCESCHGPAGSWVGPHTTLAWQKSGWEGAGEQAKLSLGMTNTRKLATRAKTCTQCHIGASDRDMNHDLVAAGHPRLNFEFSAYLAAIPKHWREHRSPEDTHPMDRDLYPDFDARSWAVGRVVSAQAALELLASRADPSHGKPWPEFTEYDCFACHHDLQEPSWRQELGFPGRKPGSFPWGTWDLVLLENASAGVLADGETAGGEGLKQLTVLMQDSKSYRQSSREQIATLAADIALQLEALAAKVEQMPAQDFEAIQSWMTSVSASPDASSDWDHAAQITLALQALAETRKVLDPKLDTAELSQKLAELLEQLRFSHGETQFDSPRDFQPANFQKALEDF